MYMHRKWCRRKSRVVIPSEARACPSESKGTLVFSYAGTAAWYSSYVPLKSIIL